MDQTNDIIRKISIELNRIIVAMSDVEGDRIRAEYFDMEGNLKYEPMYDYYEVKRRLRLEYHDLYHKLMKLKEKENGKS